MSDHNRISTHHIDTISGGEVTRIRKSINSGLLVDPIPNSLSSYHKNCIVDSEENNE